MGMGGRIQAGWQTQHDPWSTAMTKLLPTVAADLCYIDDEVEVWAAGLHRAVSQSFPTVMNSKSIVGYRKRPGHIRSYRNSSPFTGPSKKKKKKYLFCFVLPVLVPSFTITPLCNFNHLKTPMQDCTRNTWQSNFKFQQTFHQHLLVSVPTFLSSPHPPPFQSLSTRGCRNEHRNRDKIRIGCELG